MEDLLNNFHFLRPWYLLLLILPIIGYRYFFTGMKNRSSWEMVCDRKLLDFLLIRGSSGQRSFIGYVAMIGLTGAILALAGPSWQKDVIPTFSAGNPVMLLMNLSSDMDEEDITPNRLTRAKFAVDDLLKSINQPVGLIVYTGEPYLIAPLTEDQKIIINLLPAISRDIMPENGDRLNRAIDLAVESLRQSGYSKGDIVVLTADIGQGFNETLKSATSAVQAGYKVSVIGIRSNDNEKLAMLASAGKGIYVNEVSNIADYINAQSVSDLKQNDNQREVWQDGGYYLLIIPLLCGLLLFRRGVFGVLIWLMTASNAYCGFFTNANQDGAKAFAQGDYETAANRFQNQDWKAAALYRQGNYDEALGYYSKLTGVENLYNQGNALAKGGNIDEAIKKYEEVLSQNPDHEDARFNLEYLKQQKSQSQSQSDNQQSSSDENKKDQQEDKSQTEDTPSADEQKDDSSSEENQEQNQDNNQNDQDDNSGEQEEQNGQSQQSTSGENNDDSSSEQSRQNASLSPDEQQSDKEQKQPVGGESSEQQGNFDEESQAREMAYRNIPEDAGGLLRAFIRKEYNQNRYGDR